MTGRSIIMNARTQCAGGGGRDGPRRNHGFTLAELLIVVAVIAILVALAIPTFENQLEKSRQTVDLTTLRQAYAIARIAEMDQMVDGKKISEYDSFPVEDDTALYAWAAFWYNPDTGDLTFADNNSKTASEDYTQFGKARSAKLRVDTSNLNSKIIRYVDEDKNEVENPNINTLAAVETDAGPGTSNKGVLVVFASENSNNDKPTVLYSVSYVYDAKEYIKPLADSDNFPQFEGLGEVTPSVVEP